MTTKNENNNASVDKFVEVAARVFMPFIAAIVGGCSSYLAIRDDLVRLNERTTIQAEEIRRAHQRIDAVLNNKNK